MGLGDTAAARADYETALINDDTLADAWLGLAETYETEGDLEKALNIFYEASEKVDGSRIREKNEELGSKQAATHVHAWLDATCTDPRMCSTRGATEGDPLGHTWLDATCTDPRTCSTCGVTDGNSLGHDMLPATYFTPSTCSHCGLTSGKSLRESATILAHGPCDWGLSWSLDDFGFLRISGVGEMDIFIGAGAYNDQPWAEYRDHIVGVVIESGVKNISDGAFWDCAKLTNIVIPKSVTTVDFAFFECPSLTNIYYEGTAEEWKAIVAGAVAVEEEWIPNTATIHYNWSE